MHYEDMNNSLCIPINLIKDINLLICYGDKRMHDLPDYGKNKTTINPKYFLIILIARF